jgi:hypothetical protein
MGVYVRSIIKALSARKSAATIFSNLWSKNARLDQQNVIISKLATNCNITFTVCRKLFKSWPLRWWNASSYLPGGDFLWSKKFLLLFYRLQTIQHFKPSADSLIFNSGLYTHGGTTRQYCREKVRLPLSWNDSRGLACRRLTPGLKKYCHL